MNPTDPREAEITELRAIAAGLQRTNGALESQHKKLTEDLKNALNGEAFYKRGYELATERNSKLAAEIAELKRSGRCECRFAEPPIEYHQGFKVEPGASQMIWTNRCALHAVQVDKETATLRAELEAVRKEAEALRLQHEKSLESNTPVGSCGCLTKTPEIRYHRAGCKYRLIMEKFEAIAERNTALAAKDAAEKRVAELEAESEASAFELSPVMVQARNDQLNARLSELVEYIKRAPHSAICNDAGVGRCTCWKAAALTPAPTQEPPAGGVTISNPSAGEMTAAHTLQFGQGNSPADVPSEGRGELLPFNLADALAGKPVVTRKGKPITKIEEHGHSIFGEMDGVKHAWHKDGVYSRACESGWDLFMLPTEGSGTQPCRCDGCGQLETKLTQCEDDVLCDDCMRADDVYTETRGDF